MMVHSDGVTHLPSSTVNPSFFSNLYIKDELPLCVRKLPIMS